MSAVLGFVLVALDYLLWILTLGPLITLYKNFTARTIFAVPVGEASINGEGTAPSKVWRSVEAQAAKQLCSTPYTDCKTVYDALSRSYKKFAGRRAQGSRPLLSWKKDDGFKFPAKVFGDTQWRSYGQLATAVKEFGAGLRALGVEPQPGNVSSGGDHKGILIYDETSSEWMIAAQGAFTQDIVVATAYATLGIDAVEKAVKQGSATALICNRKAMPDVIKRVDKLLDLKAIIYTDVLCTVEEKEQKVDQCSGPRVLAFEEVLELGRSSPIAPTPPSPTSVAVLMYTSGSTGDPKGVMITHKNLLSMIAAVEIQFGHVLKEGNDEVYIGYLPLAHILELAAEFFFYCTGNVVGYADPKSLLGGPEKAYPTGGLEEFKPTLMAGVPKVWESIKAGAQAKVAKAGPTAQFLISLAVEKKAAATKQRRSTPLFNVLLAKFKKTTGGHLKACLSGGGAISAEVQEWVRTALGCPLVQGYGLTETTGGATVQMYDDLSIGIAGTPLSSIEIALHSEPEITDNDGNPYLATDTVHSTGAPCAGRGEVWLRGKNVTSGYYKMPQQTSADFDKDGFFHTGDIGMLTPGGALLIIDRKKNLVKLKGGEYVALEKMNGAYNCSSFVNVDAGGVCCQADDALDRAVCVAQCKPEELEKLAGKLGITFKDVEELCSNPKIQEEVLANFKDIAKKSGLTALETVVAVYPLVEPWSPQNGCLTATQKLVSKTVWKFQKAEFEVIRKKGGAK